MFTYCVTDETGRAKIGISIKPEARLIDLQVGNPEKLLLYGTMPGDHEYELHHRFAHNRLQGEWFKATADLLGEFNADRIGTVFDGRLLESMTLPEDRPVIQEIDPQIGKQVLCPACVQSPGLVQEVFWDTETYEKAPSEEFLKIIFKGEYCDHLFEVAISKVYGTVSYRRIIRPEDRVMKRQEKK